MVGSIFIPTLFVKCDSTPSLIPFQESLLLDNQYRPDLQRPYVRLIGQSGLIKLNVEQSEALKDLTIKSPQIQEVENLSHYPSKVLLNRVKVNSKTDLVVDQKNIPQGRYPSTQGGRIWKKKRRIRKTGKQNTEVTKKNVVYFQPA